MTPLVGRHIHKIDKKGRVSVPKLFRDSFAGQDFAGLFAYPLFKVAAIEACGEDFMSRLSESLEDMDLFSDEHDDLASVILGNAHPLPFDPEGRVVLPEELLDFLLAHKFGQGAPGFGRFQRLSGIFLKVTIQQEKPEEGS